MEIDYYYSVASPFAYLGSSRFQDLVTKYKIKVNEKLVDLVGRVFPETGGLPVPKRSPQRQKYRLDELIRWSDFLKIKINQKPKFFPPKDPHLPARFTMAAIQSGKNLIFGHDCLKALWAGEADISDLKFLKDLASDHKLDPDKILKMANSESIKKMYDENTKEAITKGVFGAPTYILQNEIFWGQDRIDFLERKLKKISQ